MRKLCLTCGVDYDDEFHSTLCPHEWFPTVLIDSTCTCPHEHPADQGAANRQFRELLDDLRSSV